VAPRILSLDGVWYLRGFKPGEGEKKGAYKEDYKTDGWIKARVPGVVHLDLLENGLIPDPFYGLNEEKVRWVEEMEWWYRREFDLPEDIVNMDAVEIHFMGLDTFATIWLNGVKVGETDNMFIPWVFDVKKLVKPGRNVIAIKFAPPTKTLEEIKAREEKMKRVFLPPRAYGRKAQYSFGWDWAPRLPTSGIWRSVKLIAYNTARLGHIAALPVKVTKEEADMRVEAEVYAIREVEARITFELSYGEERYDKVVQLRLEPGYNEVRTSIRVPKPKLWWPHGYGPQNLYQFKVKLEGEGELLDEKSTRVGIRSIELVQEPDEEGKSFIFKINGVPIFCKGANWIPADSFLPRVTREKYEALLNMVVEANMNMLRVWGGGIYEDDVFYDLCDEKGIMIWHDFMFACAAYPEKSWFIENVKREVEEVVKRLRNHPSIVLWCGDNECEWAESGRVISHRIIPDICARLDPTRPYWPSSPYGGKDPNSPHEGDRHSWDVWHGWLDYDGYTHDPARFVSEFGIQSPPDMETIEAFTAPEDRWFFSKVMEYHNKQPHGNERIFWYLIMHYRIPRDLEELVYWAQVNQGEGLKTGIEHWRRRKFRTSGCLIWQLNDCWPVVSWSLIDYYLRPKASYYIVKRAFSPILVSLVKEGESVSVYIVSDKLVDMNGKLEFMVQDVNGNIFYREAIDVKVPANSSIRVMSKDLKDLPISDRTTQYLLARLLVGDKVVSENVLFLERVKHLKLPKPNIKAEVKKVDPKGLRFLVRIRTDKYAKAVKLKLMGIKAKFSDNYFDLLPNTVKGVIVEVEEPTSEEEIRRKLTVTSIYTVEQ